MITLRLMLQFPQIRVFRHRMKLINDLPKWMLCNMVPSIKFNSVHNWHEPAINHWLTIKEEIRLKKRVSLGRKFQGQRIRNPQPKRLVEHKLKGQAFPKHNKLDVSYTGQLGHQSSFIFKVNDYQFFFYHFINGEGKGDSNQGLENTTKGTKPPKHLMA